MSGEQDRLAKRPEPTPPLCELCGRRAFVAWHCVGVDVDDEAECASEERGPGFWLCQDMCHPTAHALMAELGGPGRASEAMLRMVARLETAVIGTRRRYRKKGGQS